MGMYTELVMACELKRETPKNVINVLQYMLSNKDEDLDKFEIPKNELFGDTRWRYMLTCDSYYFTGISNSILEYDKLTGGDYYLTIRCNLKNYDYEIEKFLNWIKDYIATDNDDFLGYYRYEENREPTLIYLSALLKEAEE